MLIDFQTTEKTPKANLKNRFLKILVQISTCFILSFYFLYKIVRTNMFYQRLTINFDIRFAR